MQAEGCPGLCTSVSGWHPNFSQASWSCPTLQQQSLPLPTATGPAERVTQSGPMSSSRGHWVTGVPPPLRPAQERSTQGQGRGVGAMGKTEAGYRFWSSRPDSAPRWRFSCSGATEFLCFSQVAQSAVTCHSRRGGGKSTWILKAYCKSQLGRSALSRMLPTASATVGVQTPHPGKP